MGLNIIEIKEEGEQMDKVIEETMAIIDMYPDIFPHMYKQGFKLVGRIKKGNLVLQDGVMITFTQYLFQHCFQAYFVIMWINLCLKICHYIPKYFGERGVYLEG